MTDTPPSRSFVCAVDVGTTSARAGIVDHAGRLLSRAFSPIALNRPRSDQADYDSEDVWRAVCAAVRAALCDAGIDAGAVRAIGFDATCSLVVRDRTGAPLAVSSGGESRWDTIAWFDHRALEEADRCTETRHRVLDFIGGVMSPEMQTPKLMWLARNRPDAWKRAGHFFDLADFLTWRATGSTARSQCTLTSKWTYLAHDGGWRPDFFAEVGVPDLLVRGGLPERATPVGSAVGRLAARAAAELGLRADCVVATGLIDAFAGALGVIGAYRDGEIERRLALIAGTSSCIMGFSADPKPMKGVWGPYYGVAVPELWLYEAGQSAAGALLDHIIRNHQAGGEPTAAMHANIVARVRALREQEGADLAPKLHLLPDFHGNRSPLADPYARGVISGVTLDGSFDGLCRLYWRTAVAIVLGLRHILDHLHDHGAAIDTLHVTGGHTRNPLLMELYADATGCTVCESSTDDAVLIGAAMNAAAASGLYSSLQAACAAMQPSHRERHPDPAAKPKYDRDYRVFQAMLRHRDELQVLMNQPIAGMT